MMIKKALNPGQDGPAGSCPVPAQGTLSMMWLGGAGLCQPLPPPPPPPRAKVLPRKGAIASCLWSGLVSKIGRGRILPICLT